MVTPAQLFGPGYSNGVFQAYVSGQIGAIYAFDVSTNLNDWSPLESQAFTNPIALFTDTNTGGSGLRFYRVRPVAVDYAPDSIQGESINFAVAEGTAPLATNGFFQFIADASNSAYQTITGSSMTSATGTFQYQKNANSGSRGWSLRWTLSKSRLSLQSCFHNSDFGFSITPARQLRRASKAGSFTMAQGSRGLFRPEIITSCLTFPGLLLSIFRQTQIRPY